MRIETVFGIVAVGLLLALGAFALSSGERGGSVVPSAAAADVGAGGLDACACYEQAFAAASRNADPQRPLYEGGYLTCRESAGRPGGQAWSAGWANGAAGAASKRSCRAIGR